MEKRASRDPDAWYLSEACGPGRRVFWVDENRTYHQGTVFMWDEAHVHVTVVLDDGSFVQLVGQPE
jgi:hypothetical protein